MLGATQAVLLGAAVCPLAGYAATVTGIPGLRAYWRLGEGSGTWMGDTTVGARHGTYTLPVGFGAPGLPQDSDGAVSFNATGYATVAHDTGLALSALSVSLWFQLPNIPTGRQAILFSKDGSGLLDGDFVIAVEEDGELYVHFQDTSTSHRITSDITIIPNITYHVVVTADATGFALWHDGRHMGGSTGFTGAWIANTRNIQVAKVAWQAALTEAVIDEIALYECVLMDEDIIRLSQRSEAPVANDDSATVEENDTVAIDVALNDHWVGRPDDLTVEVMSQGSNGMATVVGSRIEYAADDLTAAATDSFTYRITDQNGTSGIATVGVDITVPMGGGGDDGFGGTLVFDWQPDATWIDGVPLAARHYDQNPGGVSDIDRWTGGASVGAGLIKSITPDVSTGNGDVCWNRAPTGHPALEVWAKKGTGGGSNVLGFYIHLFDAFQGTPRHCRVVVEVMNCSSTNPTTYKGQGVGTTGGAFPDFEASYTGALANPPSTTNSTCKYPCGMHMGHYNGAHGGCRANWWQGAPCATLPSPSYCGSEAFTFNPDRGSVRMQAGSSGRMNSYNYRYDRPGRCGQAGPGDSDFKLNSPGIQGVFHRLEIEARLTSEAACPNDAIYNNPPIAPSLTGDGFAKYYMTKDIDNALGGGAGARNLIVQDTNILWFCRTDNVFGKNDLYKETAPGANINGIWLNYYYGGSTGSQEEAWLWIRRLQFYVYP